MKIIVCAKEVLDPDTLNAFAVDGRLRIDHQTKQVVAEGVPSIMNAYDVQAVEAALRLRDQGHSCVITGLNLGARNPGRFFQHAFAMGLDEAHSVQDPEFENLDAATTSAVLAAAIQHLGGADLILAGRQASDDDQGVVGSGIAGALGLPCVTNARDVQYMGDNLFRVIRVLPDGEETVEVEAPVVVTVSNELGTPRYPTLRQIIEARKKSLTELTASHLGIGPEEITAFSPRIRRADLMVSASQGSCELIQGDTVQELATSLARRLRAEQLI